MVWRTGAFGEEGVSGVKVERRFGFLVNGIGRQVSSLACAGACRFGSDPSLLRGRLAGTASNGSSHTSCWPKMMIREKDRYCGSMNFLFMMDNDQRPGSIASTWAIEAALRPVVRSAHPGYIGYGRLLQKISLLSTPT